MGETKEPEFRLEVEESEETALPYKIPQPKNKTWWAYMIIYTLFVLLGQSTATLLGRLYYNKGGNNIFLSALLETIGFPILIPFSLSRNDKLPIKIDHKPVSNLIKASVYISIGLFQAASSVLYSIGLRNLPVSTFSLINTTQLAFSALFSFFINQEKFTFLVLNALVLVTISSTLLILESDNEKNPKRDRFLVGFLCTLIASALYSLLLSLTQIAFQKLLKMETFSIVLNMVMYQSLVATILVMVPFFISGELSDLGNEMENFELGKVLYVMVLVVIGVGWQVYSIGAVGLIFEVSSLFSNVISTVGLPVVPVLAVVFFHETMDGVKVISIFLAVWGFVSYVYQHYLDDCNSGENGKVGQELPVAEKN